VKRALDPDVLARQVLRAVEGNRAMLVTPRVARLQWRLGRLSPRLVQAASIRFVAKTRRQQAAGPPR
jgi:hypothetical protein